ncbi:phosphatase PAP2 family protein, partial [Erwinia amylovora]|nr:phosphatase PAP2 family protein [Erwinia amylovora]
MAKQGHALADKVCLTASGYDFGRNQQHQQQADVDMLAAFSRLTATTLQQNIATLEAINLNETSGLRQHARVDAEGENYLLILSDALGP